MKKTLTAAAVCAVMAPVGATFAETSVSVGGYARTGFNFFMPDEGAVSYTHLTLPTTPYV